MRIRVPDGLAGRVSLGALRSSSISVSSSLLGMTGGRSARGWCWRAGGRRDRHRRAHRARAAAAAEERAASRAWTPRPSPRALAARLTQATRHARARRRRLRAHARVRGRHRRGCIGAEAHDRPRRASSSSSPARRHASGKDQANVTMTGDVKLTSSDGLDATAERGDVRPRRGHRPRARPGVASRRAR